jgi:putative endonuclease
VGERFLTHSLGATKSTRHRRPFILIFTKKFDSKAEALAFERYSKTLEGGSKLRTILVDLGILEANGILSSGG